MNTVELTRSSIAIKPNLAAGIERSTLRDGRIRLRHKVAGTQLVVPAGELKTIDALDGTQSLEQLEVVGGSQLGALSYQGLVLLLFKLWDRGMLDADKLMGTILFPNREDRIVDLARRKWWLNRILAVRWMSQGGANALSWTGGLGSLFGSLIMLGVFALLTICAVGALLTGTIPWPDYLFRLNESWIGGIGLVYGSAVTALSIRGLVRASLFQGQGLGITRAGIAVTAGIIHLDVEDHYLEPGADLEELDEHVQLKLGLAGILVPSGLGAVLVFASAATGNNDFLLTVGALYLLMSFFCLCPFLPTDGARLAELIAKTPSQRTRVMTFLFKRFIRGVVGEQAEGTGRLVTLVVVWAAWFVLAFRLVSQVLLNDLLALQAAIFNAEDVLLQVVGIPFVSILVLLTLVMIGTAMGVVLQFMFQVVAPDRNSARRIVYRARSIDDRDEFIGRLKELPVTQDLPAQVLHGIAERAEEAFYKDGDWIQKQGSKTPRVAWVVDGHVQLLRPKPEGGHELVATLTPGTHFGDEALTGGAALYDIRAKGDVKLAAVDAQVLKTLIEETGDDGGHMGTIFELARFLDTIRELAGLGPAARLNIALKATSKAGDAGTVVVQQGEKAEHLFFLRSGRCSVTQINEAGVDEEIGEILPGQAFGEIGLMLRQPRMATVTLSESSSYVEVSAAVLEHALRESFHVGLALETLAGRRLGSEP